MEQNKGDEQETCPSPWRETLFTQRGYYKPLSPSPASAECSTRNVLPPFDQTSTSASCPLGTLRERLLHVSRALNRLAIYFNDHVTGLQSSVVGRAAGLHLLDHRSVKVARRLQLLAHFRSDINQADSPARLAMFDVSRFFA